MFLYKLTFLLTEQTFHSKLNSSLMDFNSRRPESAPPDPQTQGGTPSWAHSAILFCNDRPRIMETVSPGSRLCLRAGEEASLPFLCPAWCLWVKATSRPDLFVPHVIITAHDDKCVCIYIAMYFLSMQTWLAIWNASKIPRIIYTSFTVRLQIQISVTMFMFVYFSFFLWMHPSRWLLD